MKRWNGVRKCWSSGLDSVFIFEGDWLGGRWFLFEWVDIRYPNCWPCLCNFGLAYMYSNSTTTNFKFLPTYLHKEE